MSVAIWLTGPLSLTGSLLEKIGQTDDSVSVQYLYLDNILFANMQYVYVYIYILNYLFTYFYLYIYIYSFRYSMLKSFNCGCTIGTQLNKNVIRGLVKCAKLP